MLSHFSVSSMVKFFQPKRIHFRIARLIAPSSAIRYTPPVAKFSFY